MSDSPVGDAGLLSGALDRMNLFPMNGVALRSPYQISPARY
jgi:hypothetical protein